MVQISATFSESSIAVISGAVYLKSSFNLYYHLNPYFNQIRAALSDNI